ncbi:GGDEF domain-containing protein [Bacillus sp. SG-1]|uniref:GGDEF domain-containing protein n=1 Tax=Bacillus sp. SG-1 TaxID=161544 RepID=UPI000154422E|nr:GGDEF domain-containing protein [Bacillus sp. SG-1]EDL65411.1 GGDEF domain protein [Bacillus sp. SG-1]
MKKKHPRQAIAFIWVSNILAVAATIYLIAERDPISVESIPTFVIWLILVAVARHGGLFRFVDSKISAGVGCVFEFAALVVLPFPQFALVIIISCFVNIVDRLLKKHPEPFLGPDFNASNAIISGLLAQILFSVVLSFNFNPEFIFTLALFIKAITFGFIQVVMINTLISLDERIKWKHAPAIKKDTILMEGILIITGSILAITYLFNPYLLLFFIFPVLFLQKLLQNANKAQLIYIDEKTGIYNYRFFDEKINELYLLCKKSGKPLTLIFGDMDYLRDVNNKFGHAAGDEAITAIGKVFKDSQQNRFFSARFGGEEFVMILPSTTKDEAARHAEDVRRKIEDINLLSEEGEKIPLSISLGVASFPADAEDIQTLIQSADEALYEAKRNGRNQVQLYGNSKLHPDLADKPIENRKGESNATVY